MPDVRRRAAEGKIHRIFGFFSLLGGENGTVVYPSCFRAIAGMNGVEDCHTLLE